MLLGLKKEIIIWRLLSCRCFYYSQDIYQFTSIITLPLNRFLKYLNEKPDVYFSTPSQVIEFVKNPKTGMPFDKCRKTTRESCRSRLCPVKKESTGEDRWMTVCGQCPEVYPWLGNPSGKAQKKTTRRIKSITTTTTPINISQVGSKTRFLHPKFIRN